MPQQRSKKLRRELPPTANIDEIYQQIIDADNHCDDDNDNDDDDQAITSSTERNHNLENLLRHLEESGTIESQIWPALKRCATRWMNRRRGGGSGSRRSQDDEHDNFVLKKISLVLLKLLRARQARHVDNFILFLRDDYDNQGDDDDHDNDDNDDDDIDDGVKRTTAGTHNSEFDSDKNHMIRIIFLNQLFSLEEKYYSNVLQFLLGAFSISFVTVHDDGSSFHSLRSILMNHVVGIGLWKHMPCRYRDLILSCGSSGKVYQRHWEAYNRKISFCVKVDDSHGKHEMEMEMEEFNLCAAFIPRVTEYILQKVLLSKYDNDNHHDSNNNNNHHDKIPLQGINVLCDVMELFHLLLSHSRTRRYLRPYLTSLQFSTKCLMSYEDWNKRHCEKSIPATNLDLMRQILVSLQRLECFAIEDVSSKPLSDDEMKKMYHERAHVLQKLCHKYHFEEMSDVVYAGVGMVCKETFLKKCLERVVRVEVLLDLCHRLRLVEREHVERDFGVVGDGGGVGGMENTNRIKRFLVQVLVYHHSLKVSEARKLRELPLYPNERLLWDSNWVGSMGGQGSLLRVLPKMSLQFLSFSDYLLKCFKLLRLESAYEIRSDLVDVIWRMRPALRHGYAHDMGYSMGTDEDDELRKKRSVTEFHGWSRMGLELVDDEGVSPVRLVKVSPPKLGESIPAEVLAEFTIDLKRCGESIRREWDSIGEFDNLFLVGIDAASMHGGPASILEDINDVQKYDSLADDMNFPKRYGIIAVRGCMVLEVRDEDGNVLSDPSYQPVKSDKPKDTIKRYFKVTLDPAQYAADATGKGSAFGLKVYQTLNIVVRRHGKENNFKAVLETVRSLMTGEGSINRSIPRWLQPVLLGYGDPASASFESKKMIHFAEITPGVTPPDAALDYGDTFVNEAHLRSSFDGSVIVDGSKDIDESKSQTRLNYRIKIDAKNGERNIIATSYPFPTNISGNPIPFTPVQVKAIRSGLSPGLTMIVGPPGTGKTDVAVQIISNLYHSFPSQRTVLITHSNAALNDLFEKVMARGDVDERYCLRLGFGERELQTKTQFDFTKTGRVNHILSRRSTLLEEVQLLSESLGVSGSAERGPDGSPSYTCETAAYFYLHHVQKRIQIFNIQVDSEHSNSTVGGLYPFGKYFNFSDSALASMTIEEARKSFEKIQTIFDELAEYRPLELLRSQKQRIDYLLTKQVKIVAMTCTHAAIARSQLIQLGFQYDNIVMEEAGQMLDIETFVPLLLQSGEIESISRLKRICLIGDHHQLPPVVKNKDFSIFSNFDQSLFARLIRLGVPTIELNMQGRSRADIADLYNWRYNNLGNLGHVSIDDKFLCCNPGFVHTYQLINVNDFEGRGEYSPTPYYYQNVGEAEYAVALFQYMVLIGYPPERISILTTYNGQKGLIEDIVSQRCGNGTPLAGIRPQAISTVDKYQGQQNDYIILSLVRTKSVGHLRDIRRLIVAVSRARLGMYVFCRQSLFAQCHDLKRVMEQFIERPTKLELVTGEDYNTQRKADEKISSEKKFVVDDVTVLGSIVHKMQQQVIS
jgi:intron-binding protein aquarius